MDITAVFETVFPGSNPGLPTISSECSLEVRHIVRDDAQRVCESRHSDHNYTVKIKITSHLLWWRTFSWFAKSSGGVQFDRRQSLKRRNVYT